MTFRLECEYEECISYGYERHRVSFIISSSFNFDSKMPDNSDLAFDIKTWVITNFGYPEFKTWQWFTQHHTENPSIIVAHSVLFANKYDAMLFMLRWKGITVGITEFQFHEVKV